MLADDTICIISSLGFNIQQHKTRFSEGLSSPFFKSPYSYCLFLSKSLFYSPYNNDDDDDDVQVFNQWTNLIITITILLVLETLILFCFACHWARYKKLFPRVHKRGQWSD